MAAPVKVLVVDDSLTMRALLSGALERIPGVVVVGSADGADEARSMREQLHPDVMTLDVEMPGMSGLEYLAEMMDKKPMPVIMFSTRTEAGAEASVEALRLGAIDCFPKPKVAVAAEFDKILAKLGKRIKAAKGAAVKGASATKAVAAPPMDWNGRIVAIGGEAAATQSLFDLFGSFPANCPPTVVVQHLGAGLAGTMIDKLAAEIAPRIVLAEDGMAVEQGTIYLAPPGDNHVAVDAWRAGDCGCYRATRWRASGRRSRSCSHRSPRRPAPKPSACCWAPMARMAMRASVRSRPAAAIVSSRRRIARRASCCRGGWRRSRYRRTSCRAAS